MQTLHECEVHHMQMLPELLPLRGGLWQHHQGDEYQLIYQTQRSTLDRWF